MIKKPHTPIYFFPLFVCFSFVFLSFKEVIAASTMAKMALGGTTTTPPAGAAPTAPTTSKSKVATPLAPVLSPEQQQKFEATVMDAICVQMTAVMPTGKTGIFNNEKVSMSKIISDVKKIARDATTRKYVDKMEAYAKCIIKSLESSSLVTVPKIPPKVDLIEPFKTQTAAILEALCQKGIDSIGASPDGSTKKTKSPKGAPVSPDLQTPGGGNKKTASQGYQTIAKSTEATPNDKISYFARCISASIGTGRAALRFPLPIKQYKVTISELAKKLTSEMPTDSNKLSVMAIRTQAWMSRDDRVKMEKYAEAIIKALATPSTDTTDTGSKKSKKKGANSPKKGKQGLANDPVVMDGKKDQDIQNLEDMCGSLGSGGLSIKTLTPEVKTKAEEHQKSAQTASNAAPTPDAAQKASILTSYAKCISLTVGTGEAAAPPPPVVEGEDGKGKKGKKGKKGGKGTKENNAGGPKEEGEGEGEGEGENEIKNKKGKKGKGKSGKASKKDADNDNEGE